MISNKKVVIVLPAYNASLTLEQTYNELPKNIIDEIIIVDDCSTDDTVNIAKALGIKNIIQHKENMGYGANQKSCYQRALELKADIIIMVHPDYQYEPKLVEAMGSLIANDTFDCILGSRILGIGALEGGMPLYKYVANRILTLFQNVLLGHKLSEYHTGYRAFSSDVIKSIRIDLNSDDFVFDNQMLVQIIAKKFRIGEITCPTRYMEESSSISLFRAARYGLGVINTTFQYLLHKSGIIKIERFI